MGSLFVVWSDGDGMTHRKQRKHWAVGCKSEHLGVNSEGFVAVERWLHDFNIKNQKGPGGIVIPAEVCEEVTRDGAAGDGDSDGDGAEDASANPRDSDDGSRAG